MAKLTQEQLKEMGSQLVDANRVLKLRDIVAETIQTFNTKGLHEEANYVNYYYQQVENEVLQFVLRRIDDIACNLLNADDEDEPYIHP